MRIGSGCEREGLYYLDDGSLLSGLAVDLYFVRVAS